MRYLLALYVPAQVPDDVRPDLDAWFAYSQALTDAGVYVAGDGLQGTETATTVRAPDGEPLVTDGPYAETKEILGGYYLIDVPDLDAALEWAAKVPNATYGAVEVRPVWELAAA